MGTKQLREVDRGALHDLATDSRVPKLCTNPIKDDLFFASRRGLREEGSLHKDTGVFSTSCCDPNLSRQQKSFV